MSVLEIVAAICGLIAVALTIARHVWCWPVGLVQVLLYTKVFYDAQLYSQTLLQIVFAVLQVHGWWQWRMSLRDPSAAASTDKVVVERLAGTKFAQFVAAGGILSVVLGGLMLTLTSAKWAMADAFIAGYSLVAQWLLIQRKLENWYLWILVNVLTIIVCWAQALWPTVVLYVVFLAMAVHGLGVWKRNLTSELP